MRLLSNYIQAVVISNDLTENIDSILHEKNPKHLRLVNGCRERGRIHGDGLKTVNQHPCRIGFVFAILV